MRQRTPKLALHAPYHQALLKVVQQQGHLGAQMALGAQLPAAQTASHSACTGNNTQGEQQL